MAANSANVRVWEGGTVYTAVVGTTAPTDLTTPWAAAWKDIGMLSEDGLTMGRDQSSEPRYDWQGRVVRVVRGNEARTFSVTALENTDLVYKLTNPGSTSSTTTGITTRTYKAGTADPRAFGFETVDGTLVSRLVVPRAEITEVGEEVRTRGELTTRMLSITVYPAADGVLFIELLNDTGAAVTA